jgi:hypothetical protein
VSGVRFREVVIDCADPRALGAFWSAATGYEVVHEADDWVQLWGEPARAMRIGLQRVPEPKTVKNRVHLDLEAQDLEVEALRIEALGKRACGSRRIPTTPSSCSPIPRATSSASSWAIEVAQAVTSPRSLRSPGGIAWQYGSWPVFS